MKYYTPDIRDIHLGYELEVEILNRADNNPDDPDGKWWEKVTIDCVNENDAHEFCGNSIAGIYNRDNVYVRNTFRTSYLNKEQIEAEGWKAIGTIGEDKQSFEKGRYKLAYWFKDNALFIEENYNESLFTKYWGKCPSINEFRQITKLLNI